MPDSKKLTFEKLECHFPLYRTPVPGGWLIVSISSPGNMSIAMASGLVFISDPTHCWDGCNYYAMLWEGEEGELEDDHDEPKVAIFNTKMAIDFAMESGASYRSRSHAFNSLKKLKRDRLGEGVDTQDPNVLAVEWYKYVQDIKRGTAETRYEPSSFIKQIAIV